MPRSSRTSCHAVAPRTRLSSGGFSLVEMLTVIGILAIVLAIIIPALGSVRASARKASTSSLLADVANACNAFQIDQRRIPGYFDQTKMGATTNDQAGQGFTNMENIVLDLAGGIIGSSLTQGFEVGPGTAAADKIRVDPTLIGATTASASGAASKGYFKPDAKFFQPQVGPGQRAGMTNINMPMLIDGFGQPVIAWLQNATANASSPFEAISSTPAADARARFFWNANAGVLAATRLGKQGENQTTKSLLGTVAPEADRRATMQALLGNPVFPSKASAGTPGSARAPIMLHSAGNSGVFLSREARGAKSAGGNRLTYIANQDPISAGGFDDVLVPAGN
jgi:prepilin-type N-terminal cleavage/methylation domain-containing protein